MIYRIEGKTLWVAFFDGLDERPAGFEPQKKLIVIELTRGKFLFTQSLLVGFQGPFLSISTILTDCSP